jgi:ATP/maltotriose-dependent transcriptional regulator MalT
MLETVREFAQERLTESGETEAIERRHILYYMKLVETADQETSGAHESAWQARIEQEHDNLRAALGSCLARGYVKPGFRLALALWWFWVTRGHLSEGRERLGALLTRFPLRQAGGLHARRRAQALQAAGVLASTQGDFGTARSLQEEGLVIWQTLGDLVGIVSALDRLVLTANMQGDYPAARGYAEECLASARASGNKAMIGHALHLSANVLHEQGELALARQLSEESVTVSSEVGHARGVANAQLTLGIVARDQGDYEAAQKHTEAFRAISEQINTGRHLAIARAILGSIAAARGDFTTARERLAESLVFQREVADLAGMASVLEQWAGLAMAERQYVKALSLAGAAAALREAVRAPLPPRSQVRLDDQLVLARHALGKAASSAAWEKGRAMSAEEAIACALNPVDDSPVLAAEGGSDLQVGTSPITPVLSAREREVAALIARGRTNREIAAALVITEGTAANHVAHILDKLGFSFRSQIAAWVTEHRLQADHSA